MLLTTCDKLLPGVQEAISKVRAMGIPIQFVTNTSKESLVSLGDRIQKAGLQLDNDAIFTSLGLFYLFYNHALCL